MFLRKLRPLMGQQDALLLLLIPHSSVDHTRILAWHRVGWRIIVATVGKILCKRRFEPLEQSSKIIPFQENDVPDRIHEAIEY